MSEIVTQNKAFDDINNYIRGSKALSMLGVGALAGVVVYAEIYLILILIRVFNLVSQVLLSGLNNAFILFLKEVLFAFADMLASTWLVSLIPIGYGAILAFFHWICSKKGWYYEARYGSKYRPYSTAMLFSCFLGPVIFIITIGIFIPNILSLSLILCPFSGFCTYLAWEKPFYKLIINWQMKKSDKVKKSDKKLSA